MSTSPSPNVYNLQVGVFHSLSKVWQEQICQQMKFNYCYHSEIPTRSDHRPPFGSCGPDRRYTSRFAFNGDSKWRDLFKSRLGTTKVISKIHLIMMQLLALNIKYWPITDPTKKRPTRNTDITYITSREMYTWFILSRVLWWLGTKWFYQYPRGLLHKHWGNHVRIFFKLTTLELG